MSKNFSFSLGSLEEILGNSRAHFQKYGRHIVTVLFLIGFIFDFYTLPRVDSLATPVIGAIYIMALGAALIVRSQSVAKTSGSVFSSKMSSYMTAAIAFLTGSLLSYIFVLYFRSSDFFVNAPFFTILFAAILLNEFLTTRFARNIFDLVIFYFSIAAYSIFTVPIFIGSVTDASFKLSLLLAVIISVAFTGILHKYALIKGTSMRVLYGLALFPALLLFLAYTDKALPPIPLSVVDTGIYQSVRRMPNGQYTTLGENIKDDGFGRVTYTFPEGSTMYFFSSVFAPARLTAPLAHQWEYFNKEKDSWEPIANVVFPIRGGREGGYRSYSRTSTLKPGLWKVSVSLDGRRVIAQKSFYVTIGTPSSLVTNLK